MEFILTHVAQLFPEQGNVENSGVSLFHSIRFALHLNNIFQKAKYSFENHPRDEHANTFLDDLSSSGVSSERRKSLPSPTAAFNPEEGIFKSSPITNIGNISPGAGPLLMRPYHAVIEGTDK